MGELSKCRLCESAPLSGGQLGDDVYVRHTENNCPVNSKRIFKISEWQKLMGAGEPVGYVFRRSICSDHDPADCEEYDEFVSRADVDLEELAEYEKHGIMMEVYTRPAPAVDGAVLLDAAAYRWLIDSPRNGPVWNNVLTEEQRDGHCDINAAIKAAMKGDG